MSEQGHRFVRVDAETEAILQELLGDGDEGAALVFALTMLGITRHA